MSEPSQTKEPQLGLPLSANDQIPTEKMRELRAALGELLVDAALRQLSPSAGGGDDDAATKAD